MTSYVAKVQSFEIGHCTNDYLVLLLNTSIWYHNHIAATSMQSPLMRAKGNGYDIYDLYELGIDQKGPSVTKLGTKMVSFDFVRKIRNARCRVVV